MTWPESLCARVLKGQYYYDSDFLDVGRKKHASATWRAILAGREVLKKGLIKRIGDGRSTNIWRDWWPPNHFSGRPLMSAHEQQAILVSDLITASGAWNEEAIWETFFDVDAHAILKLPVHMRGEDAWGWEEEKHGNYSVKSVYRLLEVERRKKDDSMPASCSAVVEWKHAWKLDVPPKVRVFWWRVLHGYLSVRQVLHHRHMEQLPNCETCGADEESIRHVLIVCSVARAFWAQTKELVGVKLPRLHQDSWAHDLLSDSVCSAKECAVIICGMWALWSLRKKRRHGEADWPLRQAVFWVSDTVFDLWQILHPQKEKPSKPLEVWRLPGERWMKCNSDGAFYFDGSGAIGFVLRDDRGGDDRKQSEKV